MIRESFCHEFRLRQIQKQPGPNWLFLPGGAGLGSEYLESLMEILELPGSIFLVDFPGDGSNPTPLQPEKWKEGLIALVSSFEHVYLVAHSFASMFVMTCPELEDHTEALILMSASAKKLTHHTHEPIQLKHYFLSRLNLYVPPQTVERAIQLFKDLPYKDEAFLWVRDHFHPNFQATWVPKRVPTLIITGELDQITPLSSFNDTPYLNRSNIVIQAIPGAGHFPWLEKPEDICQAIKIFLESIPSL